MLQGTRPLSIVHLLAPAPYGGLETVVLTLSDAQTEAGDRVVVVPVLSPNADSLHPFSQELAARGVEVRPLRVGGRSYYRERRLVRGMLSEISPDVVHTHGFRSDVVDAPAARAAGIPTVSTVHGFTGKGPRGRFYERLQVRALRRFDAVVAVSKTLRGELVARGVPPSTTHLITNAWRRTGESLQRAVARERLGLPPTGSMIGWIGRLSAEKAPDLFIRAGAAMTTEAGLCLIGSGPMESECKELARELGVIERVHWLGAVPRAGDLLHAFDAVAITSHTEGTPMVLLEAMAAEVPLVVTAVGGIPDVVSEAEAHLCAKGSVAGIAAALDRVLLEKHDGRQRAVRAKRVLQERFSTARWVAEYQAVYGAVRAD